METVNWMLSNMLLDMLCIYSQLRPPYDSVEKQAIIVILDAMIDTSHAQKLIDSLSRGDLTSISIDCEISFD